MTLRAASIALLSNDRQAWNAHSAVGSAGGRTGDGCRDAYTSANECNGLANQPAEPIPETVDIVTIRRGSSCSGGKLQTGTVLVDASW